MQTISTRKLLLGKTVTLTGKQGDTYFEYLNKDDAVEQDTVSLLALSLSSDSTVLDVGANIGYLSMVMSILAANGKIYSFEPAKDTFSLLQQNIKNNKMKNVSVYDIGLSDTQGEAKISYAHNNLAGGFVSDAFTQSVQGHASSSIKLEKLDIVYKKLGITECDLIKVDIEGHEPNFLRGAEKFISKFKPTLIIEANHWCLNVFNKTALPDFIDQLFKHFPYLYAYSNQSFLDLEDKNSLYSFYYENTVKNQFTNLYGGFDRDQLIRNITLAFNSYSEKQKLDELQLRHAEVSKENQQLQNEIGMIKKARSYKLAKKANQIIKRT